MQSIIDGIVQAFWLLVHGDPQVFQIAILSLIVSGSATLIALLVGIPVGSWLGLSRFRGRRFLVSLVNTGMGLPPVVVGLAVSIFLWRSGPLGFLKLIYTPGAMVIAQVIIALPVVAGFTLAATQQLDPKLRLQITALGATRVQLVWLLLKEARLLMLAAVMAGFGAVISEVGASMMVGGNIQGSTKVFTTAIVAANSAGYMAYAIALSVLLMVLVYLANFILTLVQQKVEAEMSTVPVLEGRDLRVTYGPQTVLDVPLVQVFPNEVLAIIGPNGSGKTTLLLCLTRLIKPTTGTLSYRGAPVADKAASLKLHRNLAAVFQEPLLLNTSVWDNVTLGLRLRHFPRAEINARAAKWLARFGIAALAKRQVKTLSSGEAKRTSLARAFVLQPDVLFLDEPFTALDSPTRQSLLEDFLGVLQETRTTTVMVTHDRNEALALANRVAVLMEGRIRQMGTPAQVFGFPADQTVAAFVEAGNYFTGVVADQQEGLATVNVDGRSLQAVSDLPAGAEVTVYLHYDDITLSVVTGQSPPSSARNQLTGKIVKVFPFGSQSRVTIDCGVPLAAIITRRSWEELGLAIGKEVLTSFKASSVRLVPRLGQAHR